MLFLDSCRWLPNQWPARNWPKKFTRCLFVAIILHWRVIGWLSKILKCRWSRKDPSTRDSSETGWKMCRCKILTKMYSELFIPFTNSTSKARIRKGETGLVIFAGDVTPIEVCSNETKICNVTWFQLKSKHMLWLYSTVQCVLWYLIQGDVPHACSVRREGSAICLHTFQVTN